MTMTTGKDAQFKPGTVVYIHKPTSLLRKLSYQWSDPIYVIVSVGVNTCVVRHLGGKAPKLSQVVKDNKLPELVINKKMMRPYQVTAEFYVGAEVMKCFNNRWFQGRVDRVTQDTGELLWHVTFSDFDEEEYTLEQLAGLLSHHPLLKVESEVVIPKVGQFVWFAEGTQPRLGRVAAVDPTVPKPLLVTYYAPAVGAKDITKAKFRAQWDSEEGTLKSTRLTLFQVRLCFDGLSPQGRLKATDQMKLRRCIES